MQKESPGHPQGLRAQYIALALVPLVMVFSIEGQVLLPPPAACALAGQAAEPQPFDPTQVEFVSKPKPASLGDQLGVAIGFVARIVSVRPLIVEILDTSSTQFAGFHYCQMTRIFSVDARERRVLRKLRFNDMVKGEFVLVDGALQKRVVTNLQKVEGPPVYFHERGQASCDNRTGTLLVYQKPTGGRLVVYNDLTISYRDQKAVFFEGQKLGPGSLNLLMQSFGNINFNAFPSRKWTDELATDSALTLVCGSYQKVMIDGHEAAFAQVLARLEDVREIALANTSYVLSYRERREIAFLEWPLPDLPPDQVEKLRRSLTLDEPQTRAFERRLPQDFLGKLPVFFTPSPAADLNAYVKSGSRIFRVFRDGNVTPARAGTLYEVRVAEVIPAENAFRTMANGAEPPCASAISGTMFWPSDTGVALQCVWQEHLAHFGGLIWPTLSH